MTSFDVSKIGAAVEQLDWAIRIFLDYKAYIPSITLAGAAEEVIGQGVKDRATSIILKDKYAAELGIPKKVVSDDYLNKAKNWLKHWDGRASNDVISLELDEEALQYIVRALANLVTYDQSQPSEGPRFWKWMSENRPDLLS